MLRKILKITAMILTAALIELSGVRYYFSLVFPVLLIVLLLPIILDTSAALMLAELTTGKIRVKIWRKILKIVLAVIFLLIIWAIINILKFVGIGQPKVNVPTFY